MGGILGFARSGVEASVNRLNRSARRVAGSAAADPAAEAIEQINSLRSLEANSALIKTADETLGTIIDLKA